MKRGKRKRGCNVTFPQTQTIVEGAKISGVTVDDIQTVLNLCDAWKYCIENIDDLLSLEYICKINELVSRNESLQWGVLRTGTLPVKEDVIKEIDHIISISDPVERALDYFTYACKQQLFWDGNKRTSTIVASKILIESGNGILTIGKDNAEEFNNALNNWYLQDELQPLKDCLKKCIKTLEIPEGNENV